MHAVQMEKAGVPVRQMLEVAAEDSGHRAITRACVWMLHDIKAGGKLSEAMAQHPQIFNPVMVSLVAAGEQTGRMAHVLEACFDHCLQMDAFQHDMRKATRNFKFSAVIILGLMLLLGRTAVPLATAGIAVTAAVFIGAYFFVPAFRRFFHYLFIVTPGVGVFLRHLEMARFADMLALYYNAGVPLFDAFPGAVNMVQNLSMRDVIQRACDRVVAGERFDAAFSSLPYVEHGFLNMLSVGETSGNLGHTMREAANYYRDQMSDSLHKLQTTTGPLLTILLGAVVYAVF